MAEGRRGAVKVTMERFVALTEELGIVPVLCGPRVALIGPDPGPLERARALLDASGLEGALLLRLVDEKAPGWEQVAELLAEREAIMGEGEPVPPEQVAEGALIPAPPVPGGGLADLVLVGLLSRLQDGPLEHGAAVRGCGERLVSEAIAAGLVRRSGDRLFRGQAPRVADPVIPAPVEAVPVLPVPEEEGSPSSDPGDLLAAASRAEGIYYAEAHRRFGGLAIRDAVREGLIDADLDGTLRRAA